jgi:hypothetical protein
MLLLNECCYFVIDSVRKRLDTPSYFVSWELFEYLCHVRTTNDASELAVRVQSTQIFGASGVATGSRVQFGGSWLTVCALLETSSDVGAITISIIKFAFTLADFVILLGCKVFL